MITKDNLYLIYLLQKNTLNFLIIMVFFFFQMSLNFLTIFSISQPYLMVICLFLLIRNSENPPSGITLILLGIIYDLITGTHLGVHSLFFYLLDYFQFSMKIILISLKNMVNGSYLLLFTAKY